MRCYCDNTRRKPLTYFWASESPHHNTTNKLQQIGNSTWQHEATQLFQSLVTPFPSMCLLMHTWHVHMFVEESVSLLSHGWGRHPHVICNKSVRAKIRIFWLTFIVSRCVWTGLPAVAYPCDILGPELYLEAYVSLRSCSGPS